MRASIKISRIKRIFVTHLHGDHAFGLAGVLCMMGQAMHNQNVSVYPITFFFTFSHFCMLVNCVNLRDYVDISVHFPHLTLFYSQTGQIERERQQRVRSNDRTGGDLRTGRNPGHDPSCGATQLQYDCAAA